MILLFAVIVGVIALDQLTKWLAVIFLQGEPSFPIWKNVLHLTYVQNEGAAFGMLKDHRWVFMLFSTVAVAGLLFYLIRFRPKSRLASIGIAMIIGGGIGNMIDRVLLGYVVDFIDFTLIHFAVFNVADSFVCIGAGLLILYLLLDLIREVKNGKVPSPASEAGRESSEPYGASGKNPEAEQPVDGAPKEETPVQEEKKTDDGK